MQHHIIHWVHVRFGDGQGADLWGCLCVPRLQSVGTTQRASNGSTTPSVDARAPSTLIQWSSQSQFTSGGAERRDLHVQDGLGWPACWPTHEAAYGAPAFPLRVRSLPTRRRRVSDLSRTRSSSWEGRSWPARRGASCRHRATLGLKRGVGVVGVKPRVALNHAIRKYFCLT